MCKTLLKSVIKITKKRKGKNKEERESLFVKKSTAYIGRRTACGRAESACSLRFPNNKFTFIRKSDCYVKKE
jgi:hypothetical protein